jgi:hypothetical protein
MFKKMTNSHWALEGDPMADRILNQWRRQDFYAPPA